MICFDSLVPLFSGSNGWPGRSGASASATARPLSAGTRRGARRTPLAWVFPGCRGCCCRFPKVKDWLLPLGGKLPLCWVGPVVVSPVAFAKDLFYEKFGLKPKLFKPLKGVKEVFSE
mgnify:CR=1 FL=1